MLGPSRATPPGGAPPSVPTMPVRVFGPGLPVPGAAGELVVHAHELEVTVNRQTWRTPLAALCVREVGFGEPGIELAWGAGAEHRAVQVLDPGLARTLRAPSALGTLPQFAALQDRRRRERRWRGVGWTLVGALVGSPFLLLMLFFLNADRLAGWVASKIPIDAETKFGRASFASMKPTLELRDDGGAFDAVAALGARLTAGSPYRYEFHVAVDDTLNAYALPGGIVVVHTGLIAATKRPEELAGVLAHEVQHVERRHSMISTVKQIGLSALWAVVTGDYDNSLAARAALEMTSLKFSRDAESEADLHGFAALVKAGIDPSGMPAFFATMAQKAGDAPAAFLSSHPLNRARKAALEREIEALGERHFAPLAAAGRWPPR